MKKPIDKQYLFDSIKNFYTQIIEKNFLHNTDDSLHIHNNKSTLDKIGETFSGKMTFDGNEIGSITDGTCGQDGKSAYEIALDNGFNGTETEWLASLKGDPGKDATITDITPEIIGAASDDHIHGYMKTVTLLTTEPTEVKENEIIMVYEIE